jgi:hypothetical protein
VSREEWDRIQSMLRHRHRERQPFPGKGSGLLQGLLSCGHCGRWMRTVSDGRDGLDRSRRTAQYRCAPQDALGTEQHRLTCRAAGIDHVVVRAVLQALAPPGLTDALQAIREDQRQHDAAELVHRRLLHRAEEHVHDLKRRYFDVDSDRPLLKLELERDLEAALQDLQRLRQPMAQEPRSRTVTEAQAAELLRLTADLDAVWNAPTTTNEERKRILSAVLTKIVLHDVGSDAFEVELVWAGGLAEREPLLRGPGGKKLIKQMAAEGRPRNEILAAITGLGLTTYRGGRLLRPKDLSEMLWRLGFGMKEPRLEILRRIRQMLIEGRSQREILRALQSQHPDVQWTPHRLRMAIKSLRLGFWGRAVPPIPPGTPRLRRLEQPAIRLIAERRQAGLSFEQIADELNGLGFRGPLGRPFRGSTVRFHYGRLRLDPALANLFALMGPRAPQEADPSTSSRSGGVGGSAMPEPAQ